MPHIQRPGRLPTEDGRAKTSQVLAHRVFQFGTFVANPHMWGLRPWLTNHHIGPIEFTAMSQDAPKYGKDHQLFPRYGGGLIDGLLPVTISHSGDLYEDNSISRGDMTL